MSSGTNQILWVPKFVLPEVQTALIDIKDGTYIAYRDLGEMFLNFIMGKYVLPYFVLDIINMWTE